MDWQSKITKLKGKAIKGGLEMENKNLFVMLGTIAGAFIIVMMLAPFVIIGPGERGVIINLGKVNMEKILFEGFHWRLPVVTAVRKMTVQIQKSEMDANAATKDLQTVRAKVAINWKLDPAKVNIIYQTIGNEEDVLGDIMHPAVNEVLKAACAKKTAESILVERESLKKEVDENFKVRVEKYGIIVVDINLVNFDFSPEFNRSIEEKQIAEQNAKKAIYVAKQAEAEAQAKINQARGDAEAQRLQRATLSNVMIKKLWIDKWDGKLPKVMTGANSNFMIDLKSVDSEPAGQ
jgi:prohibitin 1